jgi:hypothetical protein
MLFLFWRYQLLSLFFFSLLYHGRYCPRTARMRVCLLFPVLATIPLFLESHNFNQRRRTLTRNTYFSSFFSLCICCIQFRFSFQFQRKERKKPNIIFQVKFSRLFVCLFFFPLFSSEFRISYVLPPHISVS